MATSETKTPTDTTIVATVKKDYSWLTHHIILLAITGLLVLGTVYGIESLLARHDVANDSKWQTILTSEKAQTQQLTQQYQQQVALDSQQNLQLQADNQKLEQSVTELEVEFAKQKQIDASLTAQQSADRLAQQTKAAPGEVTANGNTVVTDLPVSRSIVESLDQLAALQPELADTQKQLTNQQALTADAQSELSKANGVIDSQKTELAGAAKACDAQIAVVKAQARKGKLKWFAAGYVFGLISKRLFFGKW